MRALTILCFLFLLACNKDEEAKRNYCADIEVVDEVSIENVESFIIEQNDEIYYVITAIIINNTEDVIFGESFFILNIFGEQAVIAGNVPCAYLEPKMSCDYISFGRVPEEAEVDRNFTLECYYYYLD